MPTKRPRPRPASFHPYTFSSGSAPGVSLDLPSPFFSAFLAETAFYLASPCVPFLRLNSAIGVKFRGRPGLRLCFERAARRWLRRSHGREIPSSTLSFRRVFSPAPPRSCSSTDCKILHDRPGPRPRAHSELK